LVMLDSERFRMYAHHGISGDSAERWDAFMLDPGNEPFTDAVLKGEPLFFADVLSLIDAYPRLELDTVANPTHQAWATLPLRLGDETVGAIGLIFDRPITFDTPLRLLMYTLANLTAQAASRAQLREEQNVTMHSIEVAVEPRIDRCGHAEVAHIYRSATVASAAGGDWYDVLAIDSDTSLLVIGDVADHGAGVVGEMSRARATVHSFALDGHGPAEIARRTDQVLTRLANAHTTAVIALLDHRNSTLTWTTAGHPFPVIVPAHGDAMVLDTTHGAPLGVGADRGYRQESRVLNPGDTLVLYTDGLVEESGENIDDSMDRLRSTATHLIQSSARRVDVASKLFIELRPSGHHIDDIAILTVRWQPAEVTNG